MCVHVTTHLDLIVKDVPASVVDDFALIQQSSSVLSASGGGQKVRRGRFQAASFGATRRRRLVGYQGVRDGVCRRRGRVTSASRPVNSAVGKAVRGGTWLGLSLIDSALVFIRLTHSLERRSTCFASAP